MAHVRKANRGPSAAAANRAALVTAARELFSTAGFDAPLSAVARRAGVGQGSLYRHFPDRASLAMAVFEGNVSELEALAAERETTLDDLFERIIEQTVACAAFLDMVTSADPRMAAVGVRVTRLLAGRLEQARRDGTVRADVTPDDLLLVVGMLAGVLIRAPAESRPAVARHSWALLRRSIRL
ncbi:TetR family transcriptional regulator [Nonomuraea sp. NPDC048826]|uniref:TetR family transcriptional regulator n=1 Tax=Nonomuraea sp. NPDC048826 TaxID=3364347 RepID=UPI00371CC8E2